MGHEIEEQADVIAGLESEIIDLEKNLQNDHIKDIGSLKKKSLISRKSMPIIEELKASHKPVDEHEKELEEAYQMHVKAEDQKRSTKKKVRLANEAARHEKEKEELAQKHALHVQHTGEELDNHQRR